MAVQFGVVRASSMDVRRRVERVVIDQREALGVVRGDGQCITEPAC